MGGSNSKAARTAAGAAARKYPSRPPTSRPPVTQPQQPREQPTPATQPPARSSKDEGIDLDGRDPDFASRLAELGPVKPAPTYSPSSATASPRGAKSQADTSKTERGFPSLAPNPALVTIRARQQLQDAVEKEKSAMGTPGFEGRRYVEISAVRKILAYRDEKGMKDEDIEKTLGLRKGVVSGLGKVGVVEVA